MIIKYLKLEKLYSQYKNVEENKVIKYKEELIRAKLLELKEYQEKEKIELKVTGIIKILDVVVKEL